MEFVETHPDLNVSISFVWLPMFPRPAERRALPKTIKEYSDAPIIHYWDDTRQIGVEFKQRVIPDFDGETAWDAFILFDREATWATAQDHVLGWGSTVVDEEDQLFALLKELPR